MMFNEDGSMDSYTYPKPSIQGGVVRSEPTPTAPLSRENADKIRESVREAGPSREIEPKRV